MQNEENLIWIDLEMTGLDTVNDRILEIATVVTDKALRVLAEGPPGGARTCSSVSRRSWYWRVWMNGARPSMVVRG